MGTPPDEFEHSSKWHILTFMLLKKLLGQRDSSGGKQLREDTLWTTRDHWVK